VLVKVHTKGPFSPTFISKNAIITDILLAYLSFVATVCSVLQVKPFFYLEAFHLMKKGVFISILPKEYASIGGKNNTIFS
jgi:hypothetical protein